MTEPANSKPGVGAKRASSSGHDRGHQVSGPESNPAKYSAYIDGLRAIAVVAVLFFHADLGFSGGYVGVDVFFVISGYLITGLILNRMNGGQFSIFEFWERRVLRILPALVLVVLSSLALGWLWFFPMDFKELGHSAIAQALLAANVYFWQTSDYFAQTVEMKPLLHTWSLAVEEQFYLFFPFLLLLLSRFSGRFLAAVIVLLCGASFGLSVFLSQRHPLVNFYLLPPRAWELLLGAFVAIVPGLRGDASRLRESLSLVGLGAILFAVFSYDRGTSFPGITALLPCVATALIIWTNGAALTFVGRLLSASPLVFVGLISYSLYLWHWPVLVFAKYCAIEPLSAGLRSALLVASVLLAALSWKYVETPFRQRKILRQRKWIFAFAGLTTATVVLGGVAIHQTDGAPGRIPLEARRYADGRTDRAFLHEVGVEEAKAGEFVELGVGDKRRPVDVIVWGDSHAMAAMPAMDSLCKEYSIRGVAATHSSRVPLVGYKNPGEGALNEDSLAFNDAVVDFIRRERVRNVVLVARWSGYIDRNGGEPAPVRRGLIDTINALQNTGARIWIMKQVPEHPWNVPRVLGLAAMKGLDPEKLGLTLAEFHREFPGNDPIFDGLSASFSNVTVLDPTALFINSSGRCRMAENGRSLYSDKHHLSAAGAMVLRPLFEPMVARSEKFGEAPR